MKASFLILSLLLIACPMMAQPGDPGGDPDVPISGIEILLVAGGVLGVKRILGLVRKPKNQ